ncbi:MAG: hypothetical protein N2749_02890 [Clostridia bacterium]|nr:hypothetical protein [Clostridia bacterium]
MLEKIFRSKVYRAFLLFTAFFIIFLNTFNESNAKLTAKSPTQSFVISTGDAKIELTDNNDQPLLPVSYEGINPNSNYTSPDYHIKIKNIGTLPCKVRLGITNLHGDTLLTNKLAARAYTVTQSSTISVTLGYMKNDPNLFINNYLAAGDTCELYIKFYAFSTNTSGLSAGYNLSVRAVAIPYDPQYEVQSFAMFSLFSMFGDGGLSYGDNMFMGEEVPTDTTNDVIVDEKQQTGITDETVIEPVEEIPADTTTDIVEDEQLQTGTTDETVIEPVEEIPAETTTDIVEGEQPQTGATDETVIEPVEEIPADTTTDIVEDEQPQTGTTDETVIEPVEEIPADTTTDIVEDEQPQTGTIDETVIEPVEEIPAETTTDIVEGEQPQTGTTDETVIEPVEEIPADSTTDIVEDEQPQAGTTDETVITPSTEVRQDELTSDSTINTQMELMYNMDNESSLGNFLFDEPSFINNFLTGGYLYE